MVKGLYTAYTGMANEQRRLNVLANNLANATTTGYKKEGMVAQSFNDRLALKIKDTSYANNNIPQRIGNLTFGVKVGETYTNWDQGSLQITDKNSDVALSGQGWFAIEFTNKAGETSVMYTRDGAFNVDNQGYLRTVDGDYVLNANAALGGATGPGNRVQINPQMSYSIDTEGNIVQNNAVVSRIGVVDFVDYNYVEKYGENFVYLIEGGQTQASTAQTIQGALEASNVNVVDEMVDMITIARAYEAGQKVIQTEDSTLDKAVNQVGRV